MQHSQTGRSISPIAKLWIHPAARDHVIKAIDIRNRKRRLMPNATAQRTLSVPDRLVSHHPRPGYLFLTLIHKRIILRETALS